MAAGAVAGVFSILLDSYYYGYWEIYTTNSILFGAVFVAISGALLGGFVSKVIADLLAGTGVLSGLAIGKARIRRVA
jgi:ABC-type thiamin/hydroxymethylpyrimidine transport system permease subunit